MSLVTSLIKKAVRDALDSAAKKLDAMNGVEIRDAAARFVASFNEDKFKAFAVKAVDAIRAGMNWIDA